MWRWTLIWSHPTIYFNSPTSGRNPNTSRGPPQMEPCGDMCPSKTNTTISMESRGPTAHTCEEKVTDHAAPAEHQQQASLCLEPPLIDLSPVHILVVPCRSVPVRIYYCQAPTVWPNAHPNKNVWRHFSHIKFILKRFAYCMSGKLSKNIVCLNMIC